MLLLVPIAFIRKHKFNIPNKTPGKAFMVVGPTRLWLILHTLNILHRGYSTNPTSWPWRTPRTIGNAEDLARSFDVVVPITICSHTWKPVSRIKLHARKGYFQPSRNRTPHCRTAAGQSFHWCGETSEAAGGWMSSTPTPYSWWLDELYHTHIWNNHGLRTHLRGLREPGGYHRWLKHQETSGTVSDSLALQRRENPVCSA